MKICWDNLERLEYTKDGKWKEKYKNNHTHIYCYKDSCKTCGEPFLTQIHCKGIYCTHKCATIGRNNPFYGKKFSEEAIKKISASSTGRNPSNKTREKLRISATGRKHSEETKRKISKSQKGKFTGRDSIFWKGGYKSKNIPLYDTYSHQINWVEETRRNQEDDKVLEIKCTYCGKWLIPTQSSVQNRLQSLKGNYEGEQRFYCSTNCKKACPIFNKTAETLMKEDAIRAGRLNWIELNREVQPDLRKMVFGRDGYSCIRCGSDGPLHCHHITGVELNPIESSDMDNCITLCKICHKKVHKVDGCKYTDMRRKEC